MAHTTHPRRLSLSILVLLLLVTSPQITQGDSAEKGARHVRMIERERSSPTGLDPAAFLVLDLWLSEEGVVSLTWSDLGANFVYTVEFSDSVTGRWDIVPPVEQWPIGATSWTDTSALDSTTRFYRIHTEALYDPPATPTGVSAGMEEGAVVIRWSAVPGASSYNVYWSTDEKLLPTGATKIEDVSSPFTHTGLDFGVTYYYVVTAVGNKGESEISNVVSITVVPPLDPTVMTPLSAATEFLYTGENPIQTGVEEGTIEPKRVAVLRGKVITRDGEPLSGVTVTVLNHPEYGETLSRSDGMFDLAANGGGLLTINYEKEGYLTAQRQADVPWQDYVWLPDVALIPVDTEMTVIDFTEPIQVAQGSDITDEDGARQATLLCPEDTQAEMVMPDGSTQPLSSLSVRATEYTVGENGPKAMPAELPPTSGYTYCVELSADEAMAAGAVDVQFDRPLHFYADNFIGFPVGSAVPTGYYDRQKGQWIASENGRVIEILSITGALADIDTDGDAVADDLATLALLEITDVEREKLASLYPETPKSFWRVPITHFTPWDCNWPFGPPMDAVPPNQAPPVTDQHEENGCEGDGSVIEYQNQTLGERLRVVGTPFSLNYRSDRVHGRASRRTLDISLSGATVPESLTGIRLGIRVAGRLFTEGFPGEPNQGTTFTWDGRDAYGRRVQGHHPVSVEIGYAYAPVYYPVLADFERAFSLTFPPGAVPTMARSAVKQRSTRQENLYEVVGSRVFMTMEVVERWGQQIACGVGSAQGLGGLEPGCAPHL